MATRYYAFCWASGVIQFGSMVPDGALPICSGARTTVLREVSAAARLGYSGQLLVPGVPEAISQRLKGDALAVWLAWRSAGRGSRHITWSTTFDTAKFRDPATINRVARQLLRDSMRRVESTRPQGGERP